MTYLEGILEWSRWDGAKIKPRILAGFSVGVQAFACATAWLEPWAGPGPGIMPEITG